MANKAYVFPGGGPGVGEPVKKARKKAFDAVNKKPGVGDRKAARIANKGTTFKKRSAMAKKGWRTRRKGKGK